MSRCLTALALVALLKLQKTRAFGKQSNHAITSAQKEYKLLAFERGGVSTLEPFALLELAQATFFDHTLANATIDKALLYPKARLPFFAKRHHAIFSCDAT